MNRRRFVYTMVMNNWLIAIAFAHEGEVGEAVPEITYLHFGLGAQIATGVLLMLIVAVGALVIILAKNSQRKR